MPAPDPASPVPARTSIGRRGLLMRGGAVLAGATGVAGLVSATALTASAAVPPPNRTFGFVPISPYRTYDSRDDTFGPLTAGNGVDINVLTDARGQEKLPASAAAITFNLTITLTRSIGYLSVYPGNQTVAETISNINWTPGINLANSGTVQLAESSVSGPGSVVVVAQGPAGSGTHFILDITGYYH